MSKVTVDEILDILVDGDSRSADTYLRGVLRERIQQHGIAQPSQEAVGIVCEVTNFAKHVALATEKGVYTAMQNRQTKLEVMLFNDLPVNTKLYTDPPPSQDVQKLIGELDELLAPINGFRPTIISSISIRQILDKWRTK